MWPGNPLAGWSGHHSLWHLVRHDQHAATGQDLTVDHSLGNKQQTKKVQGDRFGPSICTHGFTKKASFLASFFPSFLRSICGHGCWNTF